jgi:hypothetical protein
MIPFAFENHVRTKNCAPFGIAIETASLTKSELSAGDPVALPLNLTWVKVAAGYSMDAVMLVPLPGPASVDPGEARRLK